MKEPRKNGIAAFIMAMDEGPFLEYAIRSVSTIADTVYVFECVEPWSGCDVERTGLTKEIVDSVSETVDNVKYIELPAGMTYDTPEGTETTQRNWAMSVMEADGHDWIWLVDADEVYDSREAEALWDWFSDVIEHNPETLGARASWYTYWRSMHWVVSPPEPFMPSVILHSSCRLEQIRVMDKQSESKVANVPSDVCMVHHFSWTKRPHQIYRKISSWGHTDDVQTDWFENKFLAWNPGEGENFHPTVPEHYKRIERRSFELPDVVQNHPWISTEVISDSDIKPIILNHNNPENADCLYSRLKTAFPDVELWDSGSPKEGIPENITEAFANIYWEGAWREAMRRYADREVVWILGCDLGLKQSAEKYRQAIETSIPFGCWSPAIDGRAHDFMQEEYCDGRCGVTNVEGMGLAVSGELIRTIRARFAVSTVIGFGQDFWLCAKARENNMTNFVDGRVSVKHPPGIGYNEEKAHQLMEAAFSARYGRDFRRTLFEYSSDFTHNLEEKKSDMSEQLTIATVDNGWGARAFDQITSNFPECRRVIMRKGISRFEDEVDAEVMDYDENLTVLREADILLFTRIGPMNVHEMEQMMGEGKPVVADVRFHNNRISHEKDGFVYGNGMWAVHWLNHLVNNKDTRDKIGETARNKFAHKVPENQHQTEKQITATVITPTYKRDPETVKRAIDCMKLQTMTDWEHLICSDGICEDNIKQLVDELNDSRVKYNYTEKRIEGDYGNIVRSEMLQKARGKYVVFMDDDNLIMPHYLERMINAIEESEKDFAVCRIVHFGPLREDIAGKPPQVLTGIPVELHRVDSLQVVARRDAIQDIGWDTENGYLADGYTLQALGNNYEYVEVPEILGYHM